MGDESNSILENLLREKLTKIYSDKPIDELLELLINSEIKVIDCQKEIEKLRYQNYQLIQKVIDTKHENIAKSQNKISQKNKYGIYRDEKEKFYQENLIVPNESFVKKELSIYNDPFGEDDFCMDDDLIQFSYNNNLAINKNPEEILFISLNEIKNLLKDFLIQNNIFNQEQLKVPGNSQILLPYEIQMIEIKQYINQLSNIHKMYRALFIDYSNQLLLLIQNNIIEKVERKLDENNSKLRKLSKIFINE